MQNETTGPAWVTWNPRVTFVGTGSGVHLFLPGAAMTAVGGADGEAVAALQEALFGPVERAVVVARLGEELLGRLLEGRFLLGGERADLERLRPEPPSRSERPLRHLVLGVCGTMATAMLAPMLVARTMDVLADRVDVVLTRSARRFLRPRVLRYLGAGTFTDGFAPRSGAAVPHVHLAQGADAVVIAPASAATLARLANGSCNDLLSLIVAATPAPVIVAPVMNSALWQNPAVARNVARLRTDGIYVVAPVPGHSVALRTGGVIETRMQISALGLSLENLVGVVTGVVGRHRPDVARSTRQAS